MFRLLGLHPGPDISVPAAASLAGLPRPAARRAAARAGRGAACSPSTPPAGTPSTTCSAPTPPSRPHAADDERARHGRHATGLLDHYLHTAYRRGAAAQPASGARAAAASRSLACGAGADMPASGAGMVPRRARVLIAVISRAAECGSRTHVWQLPWAIATYLYRQGSGMSWRPPSRSALAAARRLGDVPRRPTPIASWAAPTARSARTRRRWTS